MQEVYVILINSSNELCDYTRLEVYSDSNYAVAAFDDIVTNFKIQGDDCIKHPPYVHGQFTGCTDEHNWAEHIMLEDDLPSYRLIDVDNSNFYYKANIIKLNVIK